MAATGIEGLHIWRFRPRSGRCCVLICHVLICHVLEEFFVMPPTARVEISNELGEIYSLIQQVSAFCNICGIARIRTNRITLVIEELVTNIISYGFGGKTDEQLFVDLDYDGALLIIRVMDNSWPFDPRQGSELDLQAELDARRIGGLGLHLIQSLSHEIDYRREDGKNLTTLVFHP
jgi:serine/threonine-protein kinase RsbW